jgi:hypothetical protein
MQRPSGAVIAGAVGVALMVALWAGVVSYGQSRYQAGRRSVTALAEAVPVAVTVAREADSTAKAATDAVAKRITVTRWKVDTLIRQVPDSLIAVPEIKALAGSLKQLTAQVDTLTRTLDVERAVSRLRASTDSAALVSARVVIEAKEDQIVKLKRRPQWRTVALALGVGVVGGLLK